MDAFRVLYRNVFIETGLFIAVAAQIISGIVLWREGRKSSRRGFDKLHYLTGLYLAFFFLIHVGSVLTGRVILKLDTNFYFGAAGLNTFPVNLFFIPYYVLAIMSFFGHFASIHHKKMTRSFLGIRPATQSTCILAFGLLVTAAIIYGTTNHFHGFAIPQEYRVLVGK
jgi:hypothetical protein